jgi:hypothetical protein
MSKMVRFKMHINFRLEIPSTKNPFIHLIYMGHILADRSKAFKQLAVLSVVQSGDLGAVVESL